jgi:hypothetical protein
MARLVYGNAAADFAIGQGTTDNILDSVGGDTGLDGTHALLPLTAVVFNVYTDAGLTSQTTSLLNMAGGAITSVSSETTFGKRGSIPRFQGPDGHTGPLWLSSDAVNGFRLEPESGTLYSRVATAETELNTFDLGGAANNQFARYNLAAGTWQPADGPTFATVDWANVTNAPPIPDSADDIGAVATSARGAANGVASLDAAVQVPIAQVPVGTGAAQVAAGNHAHTFGSSALPAGSVMFADGVSTARPTARGDIMVIWTASSQPTNALNGVDLWLNIP